MFGGNIGSESSLNHNFRRDEGTFGSLQSPKSYCPFSILHLNSFN